MLAALVALNVLTCVPSSAPRPIRAHTVGGAFQSTEIIPRRSGEAWVYKIALPPGYYETTISDPECRRRVRFVARAGVTRQVAVILNNKGAEATESGAVEGTLPMPGLDVRVVGDAPLYQHGADAVQNGGHFFFDQLPPGDYRLLFKLTPCCAGWTQNVQVRPGEVQDVRASTATLFSQATAEVRGDTAVEQILPLGDGSLWVAEYLGWLERLAHFQNGKLREYTIPIPRPSLVQLEETTMGVRVISRQYARVIILDKQGSVRAFDTPNAEWGAMTSVTPDLSGGWWLSSEGDAREIQHVNGQGQLDWRSPGRYIVNRPLVAPDGSLAGGAPAIDGIVLAHLNHVVETYPSAIAGLAPWSVGFARNGTLWFCGQQGQIGYVDRGRKVVIVSTMSNRERCWLKAAPDAAMMWAVQYGGDEVRLVSSQGTVAIFGTGGPIDNFAATNTALWVQIPEEQQIVRLLPTGERKVFNVSLQRGLGFKPLAVSPVDQSIWFVEAGGTTLGHIAAERVSLLPLKISALKPLEASRRQAMTQAPRVSGSVTLTVISCMGGFGGAPKLRINRQDSPPSFHRFEDLGAGPSRPLDIAPQPITPGVDRFTFSLSPGVYEMYVRNEWCSGQVMLALPEGSSRAASVLMEQFGGFNGLFDHDHVSLTGSLPISGLRMYLRFPKDPGYASMVRVNGTQFYGDSVQRALWSLTVCDGALCGTPVPLDLRKTRPGSLVTMNLNAESISSMFR